MTVAHSSRAMTARSEILYRLNGLKQQRATLSRWIAAAEEELFRLDARPRAVDDDAPALRILEEATR